MRILVVEDDLEAQRYLVQGLKESGHVVDDAADGDIGLNLALSRPYDVAIIDRMLPKMDGQIGRACRLRRPGAAEPECHARRQRHGSWPGAADAPGAPRPAAWR